MARPTVYKDTYPEELVLLMEKGKLDVQIYAKWDVCKDTFYTWLNEKPELKEAHNRGLAKCEAFYITKAQESIEVGDDKGFKYYISLMNNKFGWEKGSKGDATTNNINIGSISVLQHMSRENLLEHIKTSITKNSEIIDVEYIEAKDSTRP
jgi:hypothetical protein